MNLNVEKILIIGGGNIGFSLAELIVKSYTREGDLVLDSFMGSGTIGVACAKTFRDYIGIEINKEYFNIAEKRINDRIS